MIIGSILAFGALCVIVFLLFVVRGETPQIRNMGELVSKSRPVDLAAFRNLVSAQEEDFLRTRLSRADFRRVQRQRMQAALEYAQRTSYNAALLLQLARMTRNAPLPETAKAARRLADNALRMRIFSMLAICLIHARIVAPELWLRPVAIVERYEGLRECMSGLLRVQVPAAVSRVDAAL
jgi:hypothetical protein